MIKYQSYKSSGIEWIGDIPFDWNLSKYKYKLKILSGFPFKSELFDSENGFPLLRIRDITSGSIETFYNGDFDEKYIIKRGDVVIGMDGDFNIREWDNDDILLNQRCCKVQKYDGILLKYIYYTLPFDLKIINDLTYYTTVKHLSVDDLYNIKCVLPTIKEQQKIVKFLDEKTELIDNLISTKERKIILLNEQRTSLINQVVTKGLNPDVKMKDSGVGWIGEIPEGWLLISLRKLLQTNRLEFQDGNHGGEHPNPDEFIENGVPFIKPRDIQNGKVDWSDCDRLPIERCSRFRIGFSNNNDVLLVNRGGSIGKVCYVSDYDNEFPYFVINPQVTYLRGKNGLSSKYVFYISKSDVFRCGVDLVLGHGSTFPFLGLSNMGDFQMVLPPEKEQEEIVKYLDNQTKEIDDLVQLEQKKIDLLKEYRQSLISEVVTGKIKVTTDE